MVADHPIDPTRALLLLSAIVLLLGLFTVRDRSAYKRFKALTESKDRIRHFRRWVIGAFLAFGVGGVLVLWLAGRVGDLLRMPPEFAPMAASMSGRVTTSGLFGMAFGASFVVGILVITSLRARRGQKPKPRATGDILALMPRNGAERAWLALLSLNAGVTEEIFFRLAVPLLLYAVTGSLIGALVGGCLIFGLIHAYQGIVGIFATTILGAVFTVIYIGTGSLLIAMAVHVLIDLNTLVFLPWLRARAAAKH
ncbi:MAG TPA: type II CAAX endopeptidase family protein [Caulobacteraceae bacterium]|jgi:hypothetical protein|nr:type II CAAX endopeptidase family protein [Caulobacteraceae bacterium]